MKQILLVEGKNDLHVLKNIFQKYKISENFDIIEKNGDAIYKSIPIYLKTDIKSIGIIIDSDENIKNKWNKISGIFSNAGYILPKLPNQQGTIIETKNYIIVGVWIMPDNKQNGMLEDFIQHLVPKNDKLMKYVDKALENIETNNVNKYKDIHKSKAKIHTWLAWQETPGTPMGLAIKKTYLDVNSELCVKFTNWINRFYN